MTATATQRTLFPEVARAEALAPIAANAISRKALKAAGFHSIHQSSDLFPYGYRVRHWYRFEQAGQCVEEVLEYLPRRLSHDAPEVDLPRLTCSTYEVQAAIHRALGLHVTPPGVAWSDDDQPWLF